MIPRHLPRPLLLLTALALLAPLPAPADWALPFGQGKGQVGFLNGSQVKPFEEASPLGPLAFRVLGDQAWVLDSLGGRLLAFDAAGRLTATVAVPGLASNTLLEDFALVPGPDGKPESVWVGDGADGLLRRVKAADGRLLAQTGGAGDRPGRFGQIRQIEAGPDGAVFVGDVGRGVVAVFDGDGRFLRELPWQRSGFALDAAGNLGMIDFAESVGYLWRTYDPQGRLIRAVHLGWGDHQNPRVWGLTPEGGPLVSFVPPGGYRGWLRLVAFSGFGRSLEAVQFQPPPSMNRFVDRCGQPVPGKVGPFWLARADFEAAPAGRFAIVRMAGEKSQ